jgi:hypothetical protein
MQCNNENKRVLSVYIASFRGIERGTSQLPSPISNLPSPISQHPTFLYCTYAYGRKPLYICLSSKDLYIVYSPQPNLRIQKIRHAELLGVREGEEPRGACKLLHRESLQPQCVFLGHPRCPKTKEKHVRIPFVYVNKVKSPDLGREYR